MYSYIWDKRTGGYILTTQTGKYVANEIRPVFAQELSLTGLSEYFDYDPHEIRPLLWAQKNAYLVADVGDKGEPIGKKVAQLKGTQYGKSLNVQVFFEGIKKLEPVDVEAMIAANSKIMDIVVADAKRRVKELYDRDIERCDTAYIAFSGGKDSITLLDICHRVLPLSVPVVFSDTDMELPDTYKVWDEIQNKYKEREFICARAETSALESWRTFAPPSKTIKWCCSVHKSTPALMMLKQKLNKPAIKAMAFVGVRSDESPSRSFYEDVTDGAKNASQINCMPILDWGAHELWLYIFTHSLLVNRAYKKGLARVGCLVCPESTEKYVWFVDKAYPRLLKPYSDIIMETSSKSFKSTTDITEFFGGLYWQARKNGLVLSDGINNPLEVNSELKTTFQSPHFKKEMFYEWIKTVGNVVYEIDQQFLKLPNTLDNGIPFEYHAPYTGGGTLTINFRSEDEKKNLLPVLRNLLNKVSSCVACKNCEAECLHGAITIIKRNIKVNKSKCIRCRKCYDAESKYCWRYKSMYKPSTEKNNIMRGIANYENFGLRENDQYQWVSILVELGDDFFPWHEGHPLGKNMVKASARIWFTQAMLINEDSRSPTLLVELFRKNGGYYSFGWELIWMALVNNSALVKWYCTSTEIGKSYTINQLMEMLAYDYPLLGKSAIDGGLAALKDMLTKSPLGGDGTVTQPLKKGRSVTSITRNAKAVHPLTILYSLYLIADKAQYSNFNVSKMLTADIESKFVSPLVAFGITPDTFKKQCEGLRTRYPNYIGTTFTHGNDAIEVFPKKYALEDIIRLALEE